MISFLSVRGLIVWHLWIQEARTDTVCSSEIARLFSARCSAPTFAAFAGPRGSRRQISPNVAGWGGRISTKSSTAKRTRRLSISVALRRHSTWTPSTCSRSNLRWAAEVMLAWRRFAASRTLCPLGVGIPIAVDGDCRGFDCEMVVPPIVFLGNRALFQLPSLLLGLYSCGLTDGALVRFA